MTFKNFAKEHQKIIEHAAGTENLIIAGGPGTGKTQLIAHRIIHLLDIGQDPKKILILSMTNQSICLIKTRIKQLGREDCLDKLTYLGTFSSICKKLLKEPDVLKFVSNNKYSKVCLFEGRNKDFFANQWLDKKNSGSSINKEEVSLQVNKKKMDEYQAWLESEEAQCNDNFCLFHDKQTTSKVDQAQQSQLIDDEFYSDRQKYMESINNMDFLDVLIFFHEQLRLKKWLKTNNNIEHILLDGLQNIGPLEFKILKELSDKKYNIFCTADSNQRISVSSQQQPNVVELFYKEYFNNIVEIELTKNYRNNKNIENVAKYFINNQKNSSVTVYHLKNTSTEKQILIDKIKELRDSGVLLKDMAILYRSRPDNFDYCPDELCTQHKISCLNHSSSSLIRGDLAFIIILLCCLYFHKDSYCVKKFLQFAKNKKFINQDFFNQIEFDANKNYDGNWYKCLGDYQDDIYGNLSALKNMTINLYQNHEISIPEWNKDYKKNLFFKNLSKQFSELFKIDTTKNSLKQIYEFWEQHKTKINGQDFLEYVKPYMKFWQLEPNDDYINISTIQSVEGCEFDYVFLLGCGEGIFPNSKAWSKGTDRQQQERNIFYTALTRAKKGIFLFHSDVWNNDKKQPKISSFIDEIKNHQDVLVFKETN